MGVSKEVTEAFMRDVRKRNQGVLERQKKVTLAPKPRMTAGGGGQVCCKGEGVGK